MLPTPALPKAPSATNMKQRSVPTLLAAVFIVLPYIFLDFISRILLPLDLIVSLLIIY